MPLALPPDTIKALVELRDRLSDAPAKSGARDQLVRAFARLHGCQPSTVYRWLKVYAGHATGRKRRADAGSTRLPLDTLHFIAAAKREAVRDNNKATLPTAVAMNIAHTNGITVPVSESRVNALLRAHRMDVRAQMAARNHVTLRSLYPNHLHQIDPSLCLIYYTPRGQAIMREAEFNKNKPANWDKVRLKVWRYVRYDHASGSIDVRYYEAAGENQHSLFEFLLYTWGKQPQRVAHGVPRMLLWDKGSSNTSHAIRGLLDALGVDHRTHATGHAWAKGGVEEGNNLVETHFESRLRFEPVDSVAQLNDAAAAWVRDYNADAIEHVDCRLVRASGEPMVRDALWQTILRHPQALVQMPERAVCQWFMAGKENTRQVRDLHISFAHPEFGRAARYDLREWAEFLANGRKVNVTPLLMQQGALRVEIERLGAEPLLVQVQPVTEFDEYGRPLSAPVVGEEYKRAKLTASERAANLLAATAWGDGVNSEGAEQQRAKQARPFGHLNGGKGVVAHSHLGKADLPVRMLPRATTVQTPQIQALQNVRVEPRLMNHFEVTRAMVERGVEMNPERVSRLRAWYPDGVPEAELDSLQHRITVRAGLRMVAGGAAE